MTVMSDFQTEPGLHWGNVPIEKDGQFEMPTEMVKDMIRAVVRWTRPVYAELHRSADGRDAPDLPNILARVENDMAIAHRLWLAAELTKTPTMAVDNRLTVAFTRLVDAAYRVEADLELSPELEKIFLDAPMPETRLKPLAARHGMEPN